MKRHTALLVLAGVAGLAGTARADETTFCNVFITSLPFTITAQGHYCFDRNLSTAITSGAAITINSDFVVLDLNNFKLGGGSAGLGTTAVGIESTNHRNITIRNGNIRGFKIGIHLTGPASNTASGGHVIENNLLDGITHVGLFVEGDSVIIRNNVVANTGGSTSNNCCHYAILTDSTTSTGIATVVTNVIINTFSDNNAYAIAFPEVSDHNIVRMGVVASGPNTGIWATKICRDDTILDAGVGTATRDCTRVGHVFTSP
jgi:hypothetical protein